MKELKRYVLMVAKTFPSYHPRKGEKTGFSTAIVEQTKLHTIRGNYDLWKKRIDEVNAGKALLILKEWTERPYHSPQFEFHQLTKDDGIGVESLYFHKDGDGISHLSWSVIERQYEPSIILLAKNDGLSVDDFRAWFKPYDLSKPIAIIHFTGFRYNSFQ